MRFILGVLCVLFVFTNTVLNAVPALAATTQPASVTEEQLQWGEQIADKAILATEKGDFVLAEQYWTQLVDKFPSNPAVWSNRGNSRISQNKLEAAIDDFNQAIAIAPDAADPYLNRGTALEGEGKYQEAIADYNQVLTLNPSDALAYNNRGNAEGGLGKWEEALQDYEQAANLAPNFAFARANVALALYELGKKEEATRTMRNLVRRYPMFPDVRAALTAVLWEKGDQGEAESNWVAAVGMDSRYQELDWVKNIRRWPPQMVAALDKFLNLQ
jgi:tetratricopeptide (TPR) repeat protein